MALAKSSNGCSQPYVLITLLPSKIWFVIAMRLSVSPSVFFL
jgi:hypothetical protein